MTQTVLITGASRGIGKEMAEIFARAGKHLILIAKEDQELQDVQKALQSEYSVEIKILTVDLSLANSIDTIRETLAEDLQKVDVLVNNAGFGITKNFTEMTAQEINDLIAVNISVLTNLTYLVLPFMLAKKSGKILNVASIAAFMPGPYMSVYYATKAYVLSFSVSLYEEYKKYGITVSTLCPGLTRTAFMTQSGLMNTSLSNHLIIRMMSPQAVAKIAVDGLLKGKRLIIPGILNKINIFCMRIVPGIIVGKVIAMLEKPQQV